MGHHHDSCLSVQWQNIHGTLSTVGQLAWSSVYSLFFPGISGSSLFNMAYIQHGNLKGLLFIQQNSITFPFCLSASLLSYSEFNEEGKIKASAWFAGWWRACFLFLLEEPHSECSCEMSSAFLLEGKVIEMSEREPGSLEKPGSLKCQRGCSSGNIPVQFSPVTGSQVRRRSFLAPKGGTLSERCYCFKHSCSDFVKGIKQLCTSTPPVLCIILMATWDHPSWASQNMTWGSAWMTGLLL